MLHKQDPSLQIVSLTVSTESQGVSKTLTGQHTSQCLQITVHDEPADFADMT